MDVFSNKKTCLRIKAECPFISNRDNELSELSAQYDLENKQILKIFDDLESARIESQSEYLDQRFMLKKYMSRPEWEKVYASKKIKHKFSQTRDYITI